MSDWKWNGQDQKKQTPAPKQPAAKVSQGRALWKARPGRLSTSMVALSAAAIVSVYAVGYMNTSADSGSIVPGDAITAAPSPTAVAAAAGRTSAAPTRSAAAPTTTTGRQPTATPAAGSSTAAVYKDGTYAGTGTSRHGNIEATVVISGGKITSAAITNCQTRYPCSEVAALVKEVVTRQANVVDHVSGATDSSGAYRQAVAAALAKAKS